MSREEAEPPTVADIERSRSRDDGDGDYGPRRPRRRTDRDRDEENVRLLSDVLAMATRQSTEVTEERERARSLSVALASAREETAAATMQIAQVTAASQAVQQESQATLMAQRLETVQIAATSQAMQQQSQYTLLAQRAEAQSTVTALRQRLQMEVDQANAEAALVHTMRVQERQEREVMSQRIRATEQASQGREEIMSQRIRASEQASQGREEALQLSLQEESQMSARYHTELLDVNQRYAQSTHQLCAYEASNEQAEVTVAQAENAVQEGYLSWEAWATEQQTYMNRMRENNEENTRALRLELSMVIRDQEKAQSELQALHGWALRELNSWTEQRDDWQYEEAQLHLQLGGLQSEYTEEAHMCWLTQHEMAAEQRKLDDGHTPTTRRNLAAGPAPRRNLAAGSAPLATGSTPPPPGLLQSLQSDAARVTSICKAPLQEQDSEDSSLFSSSGSSRSVEKSIRKKKNIRIKRKEADSISLPAWPEPQHFRAWKQKVYMSVMAAAGRDENRTLRWLQKVEAADSSLSTFQHSSSSWRSLETKLAAAVCTVARGDLLRRLTLLQESCTGQGRPMTGREALYLLFDAFKVKANASALMDWTALTKIRLTHHKNLSAFVESWEFMLLGMQETPPPRVLEARLYELIRPVTDLQPDLVLYDRTEQGTKEHSYEALWSAVLRTAARQRREKMARQLTASMSGEAAVPVTEGEAGTATPAQHLKNKQGERKRLVCYAFQLNKCTRSDCPFEHRKDASVVVPDVFKQKLLARDKKKGESKGDSSNITCRFFHTAEGCRRGESCPFAHVPKSTTTAATTTEQATAVTALSLASVGSERTKLPRSRSCPSRTYAVPATPTSWVFDSGSGYDLVSQNMRGREMTPTFQMPTLYTANGKVEPKNVKEVDVMTNGINLKAQGLVLHDTPPVLSMGRRCVDEGYGFIWMPHSEPHLLTPEGKLFRLGRDGYVPVINDTMELITSQGSLQHLLAVPALSSTDPLPDESVVEEPTREGNDRDTLVMELDDISSIQLVHPVAHDQIVESDGQSMMEVTPEIPLPSHWQLEERLASDLQSKSEDEQRRQALTRAHRLLHYPKRPSRRKARRAFEDCKEWGEILHIDITFISDNNGQSKRPVLTLIDQATGWREAKVINKRDHEHVLGTLLEWAGDDRIQRLRSDNGAEIISAGRSLLAHPGHHTLHFLSTPHVHQQNGLAEVNNRNIIEGARALIIQSGLSKAWFPHAIRAYCTIYNVSMCDESGQTSWTRRHGADARRPDVVPFGCKVLYRPVGKERSTKDEPRLIPGIIVGWRFQPGARWNLQYEVLPLLTLLRRDRPQCIYVRVVTDVVFLREVTFPVYDHNRRIGGSLDLALPEPAPEAFTEDDVWEPLSLLGEMEPDVVEGYEQASLFDWDVEEMMPLADEMLIPSEDLAVQAQNDNAS
eukprot:5444975-Amphidinium_carterae.1